MNTLNESLEGLKSRGFKAQTSHFIPLENLQKSTSHIIPSKSQKNSENHLKIRNFIQNTQKFRYFPLNSRNVNKHPSSFNKRYKSKSRNTTFPVLDKSQYANTQYGRTCFKNNKAKINIIHKIYQHQSLDRSSTVSIPKRKKYAKIASNQKRNLSSRFDNMESEPSLEAQTSQSSEEELYKLDPKFYCESLNVLKQKKKPRKLCRNKFIKNKNSTTKRTSRNANLTLSSLTAIELAEKIRTKSKSIKRNTVKSKKSETKLQISQNSSSKNIKHTNKPIFPFTEEFQSNNPRKNTAQKYKSRMINISKPYMAKTYYHKKSNSRSRQNDITLNEKGILSFIVAKTQRATQDSPDITKGSKFLPLMRKARLKKL
ncbi:unnamed protein product [Moneuplotes crassus]|uniref:Uncharacterized protein n=1 Tax=Euplotes crassus TaxID=5936 RepID=A0AAD1X917_EUPCR|nr:unnamed protein product [Moneuplotes crassus]